MKPIDLSLVLTLYDEGPTLKQSLERIYEILQKSFLSFEIIFVDDKSTDHSVGLAEEFMKEKANFILIKHKENIGRGASVSEGMKRAQGKVTGFIDIDLETSPEKIPEAVQMILWGQADVVTGLRTYKLHFSSFFRHILTRGYRFLVRMLLSLPLKDTETGFKFFNREKILPILLKTQDKKWFWDTEIMAQSFYADLKIKEIPVDFIRRLDKKSTVNVFRDSVDYLIKLIRFRLRRK